MKRSNSVVSIPTTVSLTPSVVLAIDRFNFNEFTNPIRLKCPYMTGRIANYITIDPVPFPIFNGSQDLTGFDYTSGNESEANPMSLNMLSPVSVSGISILSPMSLDKSPQRSGPIKSKSLDRISKGIK